MTNKNKYEQQYQQSDHVCGMPFTEFIEFFDTYEKATATVLDLGCGQGRDALFIARKGHSVLGVDISPTGIAQMLADAQTEELDIKGIVADIATFTPPAHYDVVLLDRVLHMLDNDELRTAVLEKVCQHTKTDGFILIADTPKQKALLHTFFANKSHQWQTGLAKKNILFIQKVASP